MDALSFCERRRLSDRSSNNVCILCVSQHSADLQAPVLRCGVAPDVVLPLKFLHDVSELFECLKGLFGFLNGELGVLLLLPLRALVHRHAGTCIYSEETHIYTVQLNGRARTSCPTASEIKRA